jgi:curli production assembly/transport component CsgG
MHKGHYKYHVLHLLAALLMAMLMHGCSTAFKHPFSTAPARVGEFSKVHRTEISQLPQPQEKVYAAVYSFRDQTGQYKLTENAASWSTVVTQGATSIVIQSLEQSGWFIPIEREGLANLLNERRIIRQTQEQFQGSGNLPPLLYAGIIIEGGIIAYESNVRTGGAGARYFGTGASGQYREDQVTVYLRAVSTSTGRILKTVHASKTILSQKLDAGAFRFVSLKKLLEAETGYTFNEPSFIAVQEAIDKAVVALIIEGVEDNLWNLKTTDDIEMPVFRDYFNDRANQHNTNYLGNIVHVKSNAMSFGVDAGGVYYDGDFKSPTPKPVASLSLGFMQRRAVNLSFNIGLGAAATTKTFFTNYAFSSLAVRYDFFRFINTPYVSLGYGVGYKISENWRLHEPSRNINMFDFLELGAGYRWSFTESPWAVSFAGKNQMFFNDKFDQLAQGKVFDRLWFITMGIEYKFMHSKKNVIKK